jgi:hypothetical protein
MHKVIVALGLLKRVLQLDTLEVVLFLGLTRVHYVRICC